MKNLRINQENMIEAAENAAKAKDRVGIMNRKQRRNALKRVSIDLTADAKEQRAQYLANINRRFKRMKQRTLHKNTVAAWPFGFHAATLGDNLHMQNRASWRKPRVPKSQRV